MKENDKLPMAELIHRCPRCGKSRTAYVHKRSDGRGTETRPIREFCPSCKSYGNQWGKWALDRVR